MKTRGLSSLLLALISSLLVPGLALAIPTSTTMTSGSGQVAGYNRAQPGSGPAVHVQSYTRTTTNQVAGYNRAQPGQGPAVHVSGYSRANGAQVAAYNRAQPGAPSTVHVRSYTRTSTETVAAYNRSRPGTGPAVRVESYTRTTPNRAGTNTGITGGIPNINNRVPPTRPVVINGHGMGWIPDNGGRVGRTGEGSSPAFRLGVTVTPNVGSGNARN
jgi:hypothetical protein